MSTTVVLRVSSDATFRLLHSDVSLIVDRHDHDRGEIITALTTRATIDSVEICPNSGNVWLHVSWQDRGWVFPLDSLDIDAMRAAGDSALDTLLAGIWCELYHERGICAADLDETVQVGIERDSVIEVDGIVWDPRRLTVTLTGFNRAEARVSVDASTIHASVGDLVDLLHPMARAIVEAACARWAK